MITESTARLRDHLYLGSTQSLCPDCLRLVQAKIVARGPRVYFEKFCPEHGRRFDFVCSDLRWWDRMEFNVPGREPLLYGTEPARGCPFDCGLCTAHEQHTCIGLLEITSQCNLSCPVCYASSGPGGQHLSLEQCRQAIDRLVAVEGRAEILQLSGGEPTIHPQFAEIFAYACNAAIDLVMINTNGIRLAQDRAMCEMLAALRARCQVYLQLDGLRGDNTLTLRGEPLLDVKLQAVERLGEYGINTTLVATLEAGVNADRIGPLVEFAQSRP
ncbi:MAG TPA: radical SAM protein, partial [Pirellulaceae bacterium]|nr:radical SAM protein [Pirellulaceae bacterium]